MKKDGREVVLSFCGDLPLKPNNRHPNFKPPLNISFLNGKPNLKRNAICVTIELVMIMSKTATLNLRIDPETKASAEKVLSQLGLSMSTAIEVYLRQIILNGEIPFYISSVPQEGTKRVLSLKEIREKAIPLAAQYGVKRLYLFGSYARGEAKPTSDIDFYIEKGSVEGLQLVSLQLDLEKALGKTVDLLTTTGMDETFREEIQPDEILLYTDKE